jgi:hypothetical protein
LWNGHPTGRLTGLQPASPDTAPRLHDALRAEGLIQVTSPRLHTPPNVTLWARTADPLANAREGAFLAVNEWLEDLPACRQRGAPTGRV